MNALKLVILFGVIPVFLVACGGSGGGGGGGDANSVCGDDVCDTDEFCFTCVQDCGACPVIESMDASGDSITKAFDAGDTDRCAFDDQEDLNWATGDTHGTDYCDYGPDDVLSHAEMIECINGADIEINYPNSAESGAKMRTDFVDQATSIEAFLSAAPAPRYTTVLMGHNDICSGDIDKTSGDQCDGNLDKNPNDYCRTTAAAFEREFRKGLDILITIPDVTIGVASLVRVSQLCNHRDKETCIIDFLNISCQDLWEASGAIGDLDSDICGSLTIDCSDDRIIDAYNTAQTYHDILETVTAEYAAISEGDPSNIVNIGGEAVGGATKAVGVFLTFSDIPWVYKFKSDQISCCDCFHPSEKGQEVLSFGLFDGLTCNASDPCCLESGDPLTDAICGQTDISGTYYPGFF